MTSNGGYRERIFGQYVHGRHEALAPQTIDGLRSRSPYINKLIRDHFPADRESRIVDLGCGHGAIVHFAQEARYRNTVGVDGSSQQVEAAKRLGIRGVEHGDIMPYLSGLPDGSQDVVLSFDVIEHFTKDEVIPFVDSVRRVLVPSGIWILHTCNGEALFGSRVRYGDFTHEIGFTQASMGQLLMSSGFDPVVSFEDQPVPHGVKSALRWLLWKIIRNILRFVILVETGSGDAIFSQNFLTVARKAPQ